MPETKGKASFLILLQTVKDLTSRRTDVPDVFNEITEEIIRFANETPAPSADTLLKHRDTVIKALRDAYTLNLYADIAKDWLKHGSLLSEAANSREPVPNDGKELFLTHLQAMIDLSAGENDIAAHVLQLSVSHLPLRMAAIKYKSYIADSIKRSNAQLGLESVEPFRRFFNPMEFLKDVPWLACLLSRLDEIWEKDCAAMNPDGIAKDFETLADIRAKLTTLVDCLCVLFDGVNSAYISRLHCPDDYNKEEARKLNDAALDEAIEAELKEINVPSPEIDAMFYETGLDYFNVNDLGSGGTEINPDSFLNEFLPIIDAQEFAPNRKRFLRQHLMAYLPYPYSIEEYKKYFLDTYDALDDANRRYLCAYVSAQVKEAQEEVQEKSGK